MWNYINSRDSGVPLHFDGANTIGLFIQSCKESSLVTFFACVILQSKSLVLMDMQQVLS